MSPASYAFFTVLSLRKALGVPSTKVPIDGSTFVSYVLPMLVCYSLAAVLAVTHQTRIIRLALWPLAPLLALRAALSVDMKFSKTEPTSLNLDFAMFLFGLVARTFDWALVKGPLVRHVRPANSSPSTFMDALDLIWNSRGIGWKWSGGLHVPRQTRPANRSAFVFRALFSVVVHALIRGVLHRAILTLVPVEAGPIPKGSTIFDETLPLLVRYLRASVISTLAAFTIYCVVQMIYDLSAIPGILILRQDPSQWPPLFDAPWRSTSLSDFWGRRWHQMLRRTFLIIGGYPLSFILGRPGIVIGAFLASGVVHHIGLLALNSQMEIWWMLVGFGMMAPGIFAERAFYQLAGRRVGGLVGWFWTMTWLLLWGNVIIEGFARAGMFACVDFAEAASVQPVLTSVGHLVADFDAWLHTI